MKLQRLMGLPLCAIAMASLAGCGDSGPKYVSVSGIVMLDGVPYPNATVLFQPIGSKDNPNPGRGSGGNTDEKGFYTLVYDDGKPGAVVGKHTVRIRSRNVDVMGQFNPETGSPDKMVTKKTVEPIPLEWYGDKAGKEFEVPPGGTDKADFNIETKKKK